MIACEIVKTENGTNVLSPLTGNVFPKADSTGFVQVVDGKVTAELQNTDVVFLDPTKWKSLLKKMPTTRKRREKPLKTTETTQA